MSKGRTYGKFDHKKFEWIRTFEIMIIAAVAAVVILFVIIGTSRVDGQSMMPTIRDNQIVCYLRIGNDLRRGDIVAIKMPSGSKYVKRIVAVGGDTVDIADGNLVINGKLLNEDYTIGQTLPEMQSQSLHVNYPIKIDEGKYFVLGDNREHSTDSRKFGPVVEGIIKGKVILY